MLVFFLYMKNTFKKHISFLFIIICIFAGVLTSSKDISLESIGHNQSVEISKATHINKVAMNWRSVSDTLIKLLNRLEILTVIALLIFLKKTYSSFDSSLLMDRSYSFTKRTILSSQAHPPTIY